MHGATERASERAGLAVRVGLALVLALGSVAVFGATTGFELLHLDDRRYVSANPWIAGGLSAEMLRFAATSFDLSNWHPLTWLSYALDVELFGLDPSGFHATNVALHVANTLLVFALFERATREPWPSAMVAALFTWHPLHVEPVAWVSERKELLAALFGLLACLAWVGWTRRGGRARYAGVAACMALSLMAKPMWVTLPFLLLALDHWPLGRLREAPLRRLVEKLPLLLLSAASSAITLAAQRTALDLGAGVSLHGRVANALVTPVRYLGKTLWPADLSVLYPHPDLPGGEPFAAWQILGAAGLLVLLAWLALRARERRYLAAGLAWFAIALVPVIGLVQVGEQAMADRYTYVPLLGVFWSLGWGARDGIRALCARQPAAARIALGVIGALLIACAVRSADQVGAWRDTITLYRSSLAATPHSATLRFNLGNRLLDVGEERDAIVQYEAALALRPGWEPPSVSLAWLLATSDDDTLRDPGRALALARAVAAASPLPDANTLDTLAAAHAAAGDFQRAEAVARRAVEQAQASGRMTQAQAFETRRRLYGEGRPYRESRGPAADPSRRHVR